MAVATAEGDNRAEAAAEASLRSPLLDHNLISGAKNILLNISVADADGLMYEEVVRILEYIQAHASVQDDNGVIHNANIMDDSFIIKANQKISNKSSQSAT